MTRNFVFIRRLAGYQRIHVNTVHRFLYPEDFSYLQPRARIQAQISQLTQKFSEHTIGLHIRRGDHRLATSRSPLEAFLVHIERKLGRHPDTKFFLATDDDATRSRLVSRFGEAIIVGQHLLCRTAEEAASGAVVDLFCLSRTNEIWGSYGSSFGETAYHLGNGRLRLIQGQELVG
jgi:hypothetical protein